MRKLSNSVISRFVSVEPNMRVADLLRVGDLEDLSGADGLQIAIGRLPHGELFMFLAGW